MTVSSEVSTSQRLLALCKEYAETIGRAKEEAKSIAREWNEAQSFVAPDKLRQFLVARCYALNDSYRSLLGGVQDLLRAVSQRIEHSEIDFEDRLELRVRFAELNGRMNETAALLSGLSQLVK